MSEQCVSDTRRGTDQDRPCAVSGSRKSGTSAFALKIFWPAWPPSQAAFVTGFQSMVIISSSWIFCSTSLESSVRVRLLTHFNEKCAPFGRSFTHVVFNLLSVRSTTSREQQTHGTGNELFMLGSVLTILEQVYQIMGVLLAWLRMRNFFDRIRLTLIKVGCLKIS